MHAPAPKNPGSAMTTLDAWLEATTAAGSIPGVSIATLRSGNVITERYFGIRGTHDPSPVDAQTVFEAASLTKPLVSFIALQLVDEGLLDLDVPLLDLCGEYVPNDTRAHRHSSLATALTAAASTSRS